MSGARPRNNREVRLHVVIYHYLLAVLPPEAAATLIHIPNGENRSAKTGALLKRLGTKPGSEDLQFAWHGRLHAVEVKCEGEYQRPPQKAREKALTAAGARYAVCRSTEDVADLLAEWAIPSRDVSWQRPHPEAVA